MKSIYIYTCEERIYVIWVFYPMTSTSHKITSGNLILSLDWSTLKKTKGLDVLTLSVAELFTDFHENKVYIEINLKKKSKPM